MKHFSSSKTVLFRVIIFVALGTVIFSLAPQLFWSMIPDLPLLKGPGKGAFIATVLLSVITYLFLRKDRSGFAELGVEWKRRRASQLFIGISAGAVMNGFSAYILSLMYDFEWKLNSNFSTGVIVSGLLVNCWSVLAEELLFRGYAFKRMIDKFGVTASLISFVVLFVVFHWFAWGVIGDPMKMLSVFVTVGLGAVLFSVAFLRTRSLALPVGLHLGFVWANADLFTGMFARWYDNKQGLFYPVNTAYVNTLWQKSWLLINIPYIIVCIITIGLIILFTKKQSVRQEVSIQIAPVQLIKGSSSE